MIFVDQLFDIDAAQHKLLSIDGGKSRFSRHAVGRSHPQSTDLRLISQWRCWIRKTISSQLPVPEVSRQHLDPTQSQRARLNRAPSSCVGHPPLDEVFKCFDIAVDVVKIFHLNIT